MTSRTIRTSPFLKKIAIVLIALIVAGPGSVWAEARNGEPAAAPGSLSIATDPDGAAVYVDGRAAGTTPIAIRSVTPGDHRVRVVKDGYLENARVVTVASGRATPITVKLTKSSETAGQVTSTAGAGGGGGGVPKWVWFAVAGGAAVAVVAALPKNKAPIPGTITAPANALQATNVAFASAGASDPDGDALTFTWNFGDGGTATGATTTHAYTTAGTFAVKLTVSDGKKSAEATANVTIKNLTGTWRGNLQGTGTFNTTLNLTQNGANITGSYNDLQITPIVGAGSISGSVDAATGRVNWTTTVPGFVPFTFSGTPSADINTLNGVANGSGFNNATWNVTRG